MARSRNVSGKFSKSKKKSAKVTLHGEKELRRTLEGLADVMDSKVLAQAANHGAKIVETAIKLKTPVKTGNLLKSIGRTKWTKGVSGEGSQIVGAIGRTGPHAHLVEFGHGGPQPAPAHPFIRPAADQVEAKAQEAIALYIKQKLGRF